jgi:hypothetical protein
MAYEALEPRAFVAWQWFSSSVGRCAVIVVVLLPTEALDCAQCTGRWNEAVLMLAGQTQVPGRKTQVQVQVQLPGSCDCSLEVEVLMVVVVGLWSSCDGWMSQDSFQSALLRFFAAPLSCELLSVHWIALQSL